MRPQNNETYVAKHQSGSWWLLDEYDGSMVVRADSEAHARAMARDMNENGRCSTSAKAYRRRA